CAICVVEKKIYLPPVRLSYAFFYDLHRVGRSWCLRYASVRMCFCIQRIIVGLAPPCKHRAIGPVYTGELPLWIACTYRLRKRAICTRRQKPAHAIDNCYPALRWCFFHTDKVSEEICALPG